MLSLKIVNIETNITQETVLNPKATTACLVGRNPACDIVLDDPLVSNVHGMFLQQENQWSYLDLLPTNSSFINNIELAENKSQTLKIRDSIYIGDSWLLVDDIQDLGTQRQWQQDRLTVSCVGIIEETHDVKTLRFTAQPPVLFDYQPGQFITLHLDINGEPVDRSYTVSSTPSRPHTLEITVKRVAATPDVPNALPGLVSNWIHDNLQVGDRIEISSPMGDFSCLEHPAQKMLLISAGSGITPMMSMSRWAYDAAADLDITFFHSAQTSRDLIFEQELNWMSAQHPNFKLHLSLTREQMGSDWPGLIGRLNAEMLGKIAPDFQERTVYVCGSESFMESTKTLLQNLDFPMDNYYQESFGTCQLAPTLSEVKISNQTKAEKSVRALVIFSKSGTEIKSDRDESILQLGKRENVRLKSGCGMGSCGVCKIKKVTGEVQYKSPPDRLSATEQAAGFILPCIAYPIGRVEIEA
jgi:glycine betaine catabolism B